MSIFVCCPVCEPITVVSVLDVSGSHSEASSESQSRYADDSWEETCTSLDRIAASETSAHTYTHTHCDGGEGGQTHNINPEAVIKMYNLYY